MAIIPEFRLFGDEREFVAELLIPLLGRLGFGTVVNYHGQTESGMDLIVAEIDRFAHVRYHGIQAKYVPSIGKTAVHGLIQDATEAFAAPFNHPQTGAVHRISTFYAINAGSISEEARRLYFARLQAQHGDNVKLLEGRDILALHRSAALRGEAIRNQLTGLLLETRRISTTLSRLTPQLRAIVAGDGTNVLYPFERIRLVAMEAWLAVPVLVAALPIDHIEHLYTLGVAFNRSLDEGAASPIHTVRSIKMPATKALHVLPQLTEACAVVSDATNELLAALGSMAAL